LKDVRVLPFASVMLPLLVAYGVAIAGSQWRWWSRVSVSRAQSLAVQHPLSP
jgi:hypothetical protein